MKELFSIFSIFLTLCIIGYASLIGFSGSSQTEPKITAIKDCSGGSQTVIEKSIKQQLKNAKQKLADDCKETAKLQKVKACKTTKKIIHVRLSKKKYPNILKHVKQATQKGYPKIWIVNRDGADKRRDKLLSSYPTKEGFDRDEAPAAFSRNSYKASVMYVPSSENRSAGSKMGQRLKAYCDGTKFKLVGY